MADKLIYIPINVAQNPSSVNYNYWLKRLGTQFNESTDKNYLKVLKVVKPTNKKT